jgi:hypothetical protein
MVSAGAISPCTQPSEPAYVWHASTVAVVTLAMLKRICTSVKALTTFSRHCAITLTAASRTACSGANCTIPSRMNGKFTDMVPLLFGIGTFMFELIRIATR